MIKILYQIKLEEKAAEVEWLREQRIFPSLEDRQNWVDGKITTWVGVIVNPESALAIKLRHKLDMQAEYRQK